MSIALRYTSSYTQAEEVCNDAFYKLFTKIELHTKGDSFKPWFRRIIINTAIDNYRANEKNNQLIVLEEIDHPEQVDLNLNTIDAEEIIALLQKLPAKYRMVFSLYILEGYNHDEIAKKLEITASTSRSNLTRAKHKLRELIKDYDYYGKAR